MAGNHEPVEITEEELERAKSMWDGFAVISKYSTYAICASVALLARGFYMLVRA